MEKNRIDNLLYHDFLTEIQKKLVDYYKYAIDYISIIPQDFLIKEYWYNSSIEETVNKIINKYAQEN